MFLLVMEQLNVVMFDVVEAGFFSPIKVGSIDIKVSHLLYVDYPFVCKAMVEAEYGNCYYDLEMFL